MLWVPQASPHRICFVCCRSTGNVWQTTPEQCPEIWLCTAPEMIRLLGFLGHLPTLSVCQTVAVLGCTLTARTRAARRARGSGSSGSDGGGGAAAAAERPQQTARLTATGWRLGAGSAGGLLSPKVLPSRPPASFWWRCATFAPPASFFLCVSDHSAKWPGTKKLPPHTADQGNAWS